MVKPCNFVLDSQYYWVFVWFFFVLLFFALQTAMHWACKRGDENLVKLLAGIHRHIVNERSVSYPSYFVTYCLKVFEFSMQLEGFYYVILVWCSFLPHIANMTIIVCMFIWMCSSPELSVRLKKNLFAFHSVNFYRKTVVSSFKNMVVPTISKEKLIS